MIRLESKLQARLPPFDYRSDNALCGLGLCRVGLPPRVAARAHRLRPRRLPRSAFRAPFPLGQRAVERLARVLDEKSIPYAIIGAMALNEWGYRSPSMLSSRTWPTFSS
jgi:hypothetical protein